MNTEYPCQKEVMQEIKGIFKVKETLKNGGSAFFDIDGTLEDANGVPINLMWTLEQIALKGVQLGICTGRCQAELMNFFGKVSDPHRQLFKWILTEDSHVISEAGDLTNGATILTAPETLQEMKSFEAFFTTHWLPSEDLPGWGFLKDLLVPPVKLAPYPHQGTVSIWEKGPYESPDYDLAMAWALNAAEKLGIQTVQFLQHGEGSLCVLQKGINKGTGLKMLAEKGLLDLSRTVYFGDGNNDIPAAQVILSGGGAVVALNNATKNLKNIASHVASQSAGLGVIEVISELGICSK